MESNIKFITPEFVKIMENQNIAFFNEIIEQNYQAVKARGLINAETDFYDFMGKLEEESQEMSVEYVKSEGIITDGFISEYIDTLTVLINLGKHLNIDIIKGLKANAEKQWTRAKHININEL